MGCSADGDREKGLNIVSSCKVSSQNRSKKMYNQFDYFLVALSLDTVTLYYFELQYPCKPTVHH